MTGLLLMSHVYCPDWQTTKTINLKSVKIHFVAQKCVHYTGLIMIFQSTIFINYGSQS